MFVKQEPITRKKILRNFGLPVFREASMALIVRRNFLANLNYSSVKIMFGCLRIYKLLLCLESIHLISGNRTVSWQHIPSLFGFGWPPFFVNVSYKTVPIPGISQYDLLYNETACPNFYNNKCSSVLTDLSLIKSCHRVENQMNVLTKTLTCVICNSTENCKSMGISKNKNFCLYVKATTPMGTRNICVEKSYFDIMVFPPPKSIQLLAMEKNKLTVYWQHPPEINVKFAGVMNYQVLLKLQHNHLSKCRKLELKYGRRGNNSYTFENLLPWANYSVTICCGMISRRPPANKSTCTCGGSKYIPGGPVYQRTLPEEPTKPPLVQPCEASCSDEHFTAILSWEASDDLKWNGIPTKSMITIWKMPADHNETLLGDPVTTLSVSLSADYNGTLVSYKIPILSSHFSYLVTVQFCSHGGCGPNATVILSCKKCELLNDPGTPSHLPPKSPDSYLTTVGVSVVACVASAFLIVTAICFWVKKRKNRERSRPPLGERIGDVTPGPYEQLYFSEFASNNSNYSQVDNLDSQSLLPDSQATECV